jgi:hypothetical protein
MVWLPAPANCVKGHNGPKSHVYQARYLLRTSINACLKLGSGLHLPAVSGLVGSTSLNLNKDSAPWWSFGVHKCFLAHLHPCILYSFKLLVAFHVLLCSCPGISTRAETVTPCIPLPDSGTVATYHDVVTTVKKPLAHEELIQSPVAVFLNSQSLVHAQQLP